MGFKTRKPRAEDADSQLRGQHLHFDCYAGIAGDMSLGALLDLGVPISIIRDAIAQVGLEPSRLSKKSVVKAGIAAIKAKVKDGPELRDAGHEHRHYHYGEIRQRIANSRLPADTKSLALRIFERVAQAEAKLHGTTVAKVALHEVGAVDSLIDIVGCAAALSWLAPSSVSASVVSMGRGTVGCAHGQIPVPSPAALAILSKVGAPMTDGGVDMEMCTPTGAALLAEVVEAWEDWPAQRVSAIGYGAGDFDFPRRPNVLRVVLGKRETTQSPTELLPTELLEGVANIDDMQPEHCDYVLELLFAAGAVDAWWTPVVMKKGRPALTLSFLCPRDAEQACTRVVFRETTSIGVRFHSLRRSVCARELASARTPLGTVKYKRSYWQGEVVGTKAESDSLRRIARRSGLPLKEVAEVVRLHLRSAQTTDEE